MVSEARPFSVLPEDVTVQMRRRAVTVSCAIWMIPQVPGVGANVSQGVLVYRDSQVGVVESVPGVDGFEYLHGDINEFVSDTFL